MKNKEYWKQSLENVLEVEDITDSLVQKIISISEMEYEYTSHESHKFVETVNPLSKKVKELESQIEIYERFIAYNFKVSSVGIQSGQVKFYNKLP